MLSWDAEIFCEIPDMDEETDFRFNTMERERTVSYEHNYQHQYGGT